MSGDFKTHTVFTQCSDCGVEPQMRGQTRLLPLSVNINHLPRLRVLTCLLCSSKFVGFDPPHAGSDTAFFVVV